MELLLSTDPPHVSLRCEGVRAPFRIVFTDHAAERAARYGIAYNDVADAIFDGHQDRRRNPGSGDWLVRRGQLAVIYDWPNADDEATARVITVWLDR